MQAKDIIFLLESKRDEVQRRHLMRFFKTRPGEYGEGDEFLGLKVPVTRSIAKMGNGLPLGEVQVLLQSKWHEVRLCGLLILVSQFEKLCKPKTLHDVSSIQARDAIVRFYLAHADSANNWDLVDLSAYKILGRWLLVPSATSDKQEVLDALASSGSLWRQRIAMVCTLWPTMQGDPSWTIRYAELFLSHPHDLMHKVTGWMLREVGKRQGMDLLRAFLSRHASRMPRTMLRYAIEKMSDEERRYWMGGGNNSEI